MKTITNRKRSAVLTMIIVYTVVLCNFAIAQENSRTVSGTTDPGASTLITEGHLGGADVVVLSLKAPEVLPAPFAANFVEIGAPSGGYPTITDLVTFGGKLYLSTSANPLAAFGTKVFSTSDGVAFTKVLEDATSQGYLRIGVIDSKLWIPDGDPTGYDPSFVYTSTTGALSSYTKTNIIGAVHSFDVVKFNNQFYVSNGMLSGKGGLCKYNGTNQWTSVYESASSMRMKYMAVFNGKLFVGNRLSSSDVDAFVWSGDPGTTAPAQVNIVSGATSTFRWFVSSQGKLFWSGAVSAGRVYVTQNGTTWTQCSTLDGEIVSDFAELNGKVYALGHKGLWESSNHLTFTKIASPPTSDPNAFTPVLAGGGINPEAVASMEAFNGALWCGSSRNGKIYKVDLATSVPGTPIDSHQYTLTDHSIIFQMENSSSIELRIYAITGSLVKTVSLGTVSKGNHEISMEELKEGAYLLEARIGDEVKGIKYVR